MSEPARRAATRWPNLFLVGVPKAGTSTLHAQLDRHPQIRMSALKEPHFFATSPAYPGLEAFVPRVDGEREYLRLFAGADEPVVGEASTSYFADPDAPRRIHEAVPDARIVVVLRDPVQRAHSHYLNHVREGIERRPFRAAIEAELAGGERSGSSHPSTYVGGGRYVEPLLRYRDRFGERFTVIFFEELFADLRAGMAALFERLGVDPGPAREVDDRMRLNTYGEPAGRGARALVGSARARRVVRSVLPRGARNRVKARLIREAPRPALDPEAEALLTATYAEQGERVEAILGRRPPW